MCMFLYFQNARLKLLFDFVLLVVSVVAGMAGSLAGFLVLLLAVSICEAASIFQPISDSHRSAALELFAPTDGSFGRSVKT
jgi:membrane glycosyltransferase